MSLLINFARTCLSCMTWAWRSLGYELSVEASDMVWPALRDYPYGAPLR
jgi:hypothetical protein